jgi:hypothetical protein
MSGDVSALHGNSSGAEHFDRLTLGIVVGVLALVVIAIGVAATVGRSQPMVDLSTPGGVTLAYESAIQRGEADAAWDLLSTDAQAGTTRQEFLTRAAGMAPRTEVRVSIDNVRVNGDSAHLDVVRTTPRAGFFGLDAGSSSSRSPVTLVRQTDGWRISVPADPYVIRQPASERP